MIQRSQTQVMGIKMMVVDAKKSTVPDTFTRFNCSQSVTDLRYCSLRKSVTMMYPTPMLSMLIQKIQHHGTVAIQHH